MGRVRIRWRGLAKVAVVALAGLAALQVLPALLAPPSPPPLASDVGLPRIPASQEPAVVIREPRPEPPPKPRPRQRPSLSSAAGTAVIGTTPRRRHPDRGRQGDSPSHTWSKPPQPPALAPDPPPYVPPPAPEPVAPVPVSPAPEAAPAAGDGSVEFAPH